MPYTLSNAIIRNKDIAGKYKEITQFACNVVNKEKEILLLPIAVS